MKIKKHNKLKYGGEIVPGYFDLATLAYNVSRGDYLSVIAFILRTLIPSTFILPYIIPYLIFESIVLNKLRQYLPSNGYFTPYIYDFISHNIKKIYNAYKGIKKDEMIEEEKKIGSYLIKKKFKKNKKYFYYN